MLDLIYAKTRLLRDADAAGATTLDGELMLLHQGAAAFTLWTGQPAPLELMQSKLAEARAGGCGRPEGEPTGEPSGARAGAGRRRRVTAFRFLLPGESHGPALGVTIEGVPAGLALTEDAIAADLARRQRGYGRGARQQIEQDRAEILGGVRHGGRSARRSCCSSATATGRTGRGSCRSGRCRPSEAAAARRAGRRRQQAGHPGHPGPARPRRPRGCPEVRLQRRPQRPRARVRARDRRARGGGRRRARVPARARASRSGRSRPRSAAWPSIRRTARGRARRPTRRRCAARIRTPRHG